MRRSLRSVESTGDTVTFAAELSVSFFAALQDGCHSFKTLFEVECQCCWCWHVLGRSFLCEEIGAL